MLALSNTSEIYWYIACAVFASPHGGFNAVASDNGGRMGFHRENPREMGGSDGSLSRNSLRHTDTHRHTDTDTDTDTA